MLLKNISLILLLLPSALLDIKQKKVWLPLLAIFFLESIVLVFLGINSWKYLIVGMLPGAVLIIISLVTKGAVGIGDGYLVCVIGAIAGFQNTISILTGGMFICAVIGMILIVFRHWRRKQTIPFVPFLLAAYVLQMGVM